MKAMIFAAGLGTRLKPITDTIPKALVTIQSVTMLEIAIRKLINAGVDSLIINIHYRGEQIKDFLKANRNFGINIQLSDESDLLLDTGGGLEKAKHFFDKNESFFLYNVDILTETNMKKMWNVHQSGNNLATLLLNERTSDRNFLFDDNQILCGWTSHSKKQTIVSSGIPKVLYHKAFCGIHVVSPLFFNFLEDFKMKQVFSIVDVYLKIAETQTIKGYIDNESYWNDVGKPENLNDAQKYFSEKLWN